MFMASVTCSLRVGHFVAMQAAVHRDDAGDFRHGVHLSNLAMAGLALHASLQMSAVIPGDAGEHGVDTNPGNRLLRS